MADRYISADRLKKDTDHFNPHELRRRRQEQQVKLRKEARADSQQKRRRDLHGNEDQDAAFDDDATFERNVCYSSHRPYPSPSSSSH